jgi:hypothetical protein
MDTQEGNDYEPISLHKYLYVGADSANLRDASGNFGLADSTAALGIIAGIAAIGGIANLVHACHNGCTATQGGAAFAGGVGVGILVGVFGLQAVALGLGTAFLAVGAAFSGYTIGVDLQRKNYDLAIFDAALSALGFVGGSGSAADEFSTPSLTVRSTGIADSGPIFTHFTNARGAAGITGIDVSNMQVGETVEISTINFGSGQNAYNSNMPGDNFVTDLSSSASSGQLSRIGVYGDKQAYAIEFDGATAFSQGVRVSGSTTNIYTVPANSTITGRFTLTRIK